MTLVTLPHRPRLSQPTSCASRGISPSSTSTPRVASTHAISAGPTETINSPSNPSVSEESMENCDIPIPTIERSPSPSLSVPTDQNSTPALTPSRTIYEVLERDTELSSPLSTSVYWRSPTPSISTSPPPSPTATTRSIVASSDVDSTGLTSTLQDLGIASRQSSQQPRGGIYVREDNAGIDDLTQGAGLLRVSGSPVVSPRGHSRRRSSSRQTRSLAIHSVEDEDLPDDEFHSQAFQRRLSQAKSILQGLTTVLSSSPSILEPDSTIKRHLEEAETLRQFRPLSRRTVGLVGDSGVGKSSLINCLLDRDSLARTTGKGAACTCVVTEYHFHAADHFIIDVEMFSEDELYEQLDELLGCYRAFKSNVGGESKDKADIAVDTFKCMFRGKLHDEAWILNESEDVVSDQFKVWAKQARGLGPPSRQVVQTLQECSSLLVPLSSEPNDPLQPSVWPYIRKIKVYLRAHILSKGLVLVDLPGLHDLNSARRNITQQYIVNCHELFAICSIKRAATDVGVKTVFDLAQQARLERVGIICTNADDVNFTEIQNDWDRGEARRMKELHQSLEDIDEDLEDIRVDLAEAASHEEKLALHEEKMKLENQHNAIDFELRECAVRKRNSHVTQNLKLEYEARAHARGETLHVFCVGNEMYRTKRNLDKSVSGKYLSLSGIIDVRRHFIAAVGESQLRASKNFLEHNVPALLQDIELWVQSGAGSASAEQKKAVRHVLGKVESTLEKGLTSRRSPVETIRRFLENSFETRVWEGLQISKWTESSKDACKDWDIWASASYAAWLRADGEHQTKTRGYRNWNREVMQDLAADVQSPWDDLLSDVRAHKVHLRQAIFACWEEAIVYLESEWPDFNDQVDEIGRAMDARKHLLIDGVEDIFDRFTDRLSLIRMDTLTWLSGSMIRRIMSTVCRQALQHRGPGCTELWRGVVKRTFANQSTFESIMKELQRSFKGHAEGLQQELGGLVSTQLGAVRATLDIVRECNAAEESERHPELRQRVAGEVERAKNLMEM